MKRLTLNTVVSRPERRLVGIVVVRCAALAVTAFLIPDSSQAQPSRVNCGATITTNTKFNRDLTNCANEEIVIGADNITLDLNGHSFEIRAVLFPDARRPAVQIVQRLMLGWVPESDVAESNHDHPLFQGSTALLQ